MKNNQAQISYGALNFFYWASNATVCSFCSAFLLPLGYSSFEIGLIMSLGNGGAALLQPLLADYADRTRKHTVNRIMSWICGVFLIFTGMVIVLRGRSVFMTVFYTLSFVMQVCMLPLLNELTFRLEQAGHRISFGVGRAMGSLGYSIISAAAGTAAERCGTGLYPVLTACIILIILAILFWIGKLLTGTAAGSKPASEKKEPVNLLAFVKTHKRLFMVSLGCLCFMFCSTITGYYLLQIVREVGGNAKEMGFGLSLAALTEIPVIFFYDRLREKLSLRKLMLASGFGYIIKQLTLFFAGAYSMILFSQFFQMVSFALYLPSSVAYAHENTEPEDSVKGQALVTTAGTAAGLLACLFGGLIIDRLGIRALLALCVAISLAGTALIFIYAKEKEA